MSSYPHKKASGDGNEVVLLFHGNIENVPHLAGNVAEAVNDLRVNRNVSVKIISNFQDTATIPYLEVPIRLCQWNLERFNQEALSGDIGIIPQGSEPRFLLKSANKIRTLMAMKIPVIGDKRNQDFRETLGDNRYGMLAHTRQEWKASLELLIDDLEQRRAFAEAGYQRVAEHYTTAIAAKQVIEAIGGYVAAC